MERFWIIVIDLVVLIALMSCDKANQSDEHYAADSILSISPICRDQYYLSVQQDSSSKLFVVQSPSILMYDTLPGQSEINGFSFDELTEKNDNITLAFEYGSRVYHRKQLYFSCDRSQYILDSLIETTMDKRKPEDFTKTTSYKSKGLNLYDFKVRDFVN